MQLVKKTKAGILTEYTKLLEQFEDLKEASKLVHQPQSAETLAKARSHTIETITKSFSDFKAGLNQNFTELSSAIGNNLNTALSELAQTIASFGELEKAAELGRKQLEAQYGIRVAAETLEQLVLEYETKKKQLEAEATRQKLEIEEEITHKKREWQREQEEYNYRTKLTRAREQALSEEEKQKEEQALAAREQAIKNQETETASLKQKVEELPELLNRESTKKAREAGMAAEAEWRRKVDAAKNEWEAEKKLLEMQNNVREERLKRQDAEITQLKQELEAAAKKAQELAVKVIESGVKIQPEGQSSKPKTFYE